MRNIPEPIAALLPDLVADLRATLADGLVGVYLYGSAIRGGFDAGSSDLDLVIVTEANASDLDLAALEGVHRRLAEREPDWADRLDLAYIGRGTLASFRAGGTVASISHDDPLQLYDEADDWLQTWYLVRDAETPIVGPPASDVVPPISRAEFARAVTKTGLELADRAPTESRDGWLAYTLLTLCRVIAAVETGEIVSKQDAVAAAAGRWPSLRPALDAALAFRAARGREPLEPGQPEAIRAAIAELAASIRTAAA